MDNSNFELFKQALCEGINNRFDALAAGCTEEIVLSERHNLAMRAIVYGKTEPRRTWSPKMKRIVAILIAAALLLTSCGIIFRNEIREMFDELFVSLTYSDHGTKGKTIEDVYVLGYIPDGYVLKKEEIAPLRTQYEYVNLNGEVIYFDQRSKESSEYVIDSEEGYSEITNIEKYGIYHRFSGKMHVYIWSDEKYSLKLTSTLKLSSEDIVKIIEGITTK